MQIVEKQATEGDFFRQRYQQGSTDGKKPPGRQGLKGCASAATGTPFSSP
ncbi:hypothetical protein HMPREF9080_02490 [Cardiobacterium valvarum F0432]|uniref:Uncharacterized protein n=1 Tax=Cardiobacterium valvarum F0432 TaxID=797473 RepID=G9ZI80_9GAMM|nr:hypothetical protein HMPREF9080_02490 [Cardiobacterium valvarum F0432]